MKERDTGAMENDERDPLNESEERLRRAWQAAPAPPAPEGFRGAVMRDVRALAGGDPAGAQPAGADVRAAFARAVRTGAIAAGVLAVAAGVLGAVAGIWPSGDVYVLMKSQPGSLVEWLLVF